MVDQITDIVKEHIAGNAFPSKLKDMMAQHPPNTFDEAIAQLQSYIKTTRTTLPSGIRSIRINQTSNPRQVDSQVGSQQINRPQEIVTQQQPQQT